MHKVRPETAAPKQRKDGDHQQKLEDGGKRDNKHHENKNQNKHADQDVNSWKYKFHNREPKVYPKIAFSETTEIPALPAKEARLKQPSKDDFDAEMAKFDAKINEVREKRRQLTLKKNEIQQGGKMTGSQLTYKEAMNSKISENKKTKSE